MKGSKTFFKLLMLTIVLSLIIPVVSYAGSEKKEEAEKPYTIAFFLPGLNISYVASVRDGGVEAGKDLGVKVLTFDAQWDAGVQMSQLEDQLTKGVDGVVFYPANPEGAIPAVAKCQELGVPIMAVNTAIGEKQEAYPGTIAFVGQNELAGGRDAADLVSEALGGKGGNVVILAGAAGNSITIGRNEGFKQRLAEKYSDISILALQYTNWTKEDALSIMEALILANPKKIDAVYCHADNLAAGAIIAVEEAGLLGKIKVIGIGNSVEGNENLRNGKMYGTLHQSPKMEGYTGVETMVKYLNGEKVERSITVPRPKMTKENADKYAPEW